MTLISGVLLLIIITIISSVFLCIASIIYFPQLLRNKIMKFAGKLMGLEKKITLSRLTQIQKDTYNQWSVLWAVILREASPCTQWEQNQTYSPCAEWGTLITQFWMGWLHQTPSPQDSGNLVKEEVERPWKPEGMEDTKGKSLNASGPRTYELIETVTACTGPARVCTRWCPRTKRSGYTF